jgi:hypothetical protein
MIPNKSVRLFLLPGALVGLVALSVLGACTADEPDVQTETIQVSMLIQQTGQDPQWFRDVEVFKGIDAYELTELVTEGDIQATYYAAFRSHFVEGIFGVAGEDPNYWLVWVWSESQEKWEPLPVGADLYSLKGGHVLAWYYAPYSEDGNPPTATP